MTFVSVRSEREATRQLILEMSGGVVDDTDLRALESCTSRASHLWIGYIRSRPVCAWGLVPPTFLSDRAYLWLYASPAVDEYKFIFVRNSQLQLEMMQRIYPTIFGVTRAEDARAIRWIKWLGGKYGAPQNGLRPFLIGDDLG